MTFDPYAVRSVFLALRSTPNVYNLQMDGWMVFWPALFIKYRAQENFKGGSHLVNAGLKIVQPPSLLMQFGDAVTQPMQSGG